MRLTKRNKDTSYESNVGCSHFGSKECHEVAGECAHGCKWEEEAWRKLAEYEDLEEQGLLIRVPCKVGQILYVVGTKCLANAVPSDEWCYQNSCDKCVYDEEYVVFETKATPYIIFTLLGKADRNWLFGKTVFLTKAEAEQALAEMEKEK